MLVSLNLNKLFKTLLVILFMIAGGAVIGIAYSRITDPLFLIATIIYLFVFCKGSLRNNIDFKIWIILVLFYFANFLIFLNESPNVSAYFVYVIRMTACMVFCNCFSLDEFKHYFHRTVYAVSLISLLAYVVILNINYKQYLIYMNDLPMFGIFNCKAIPTGRNSSIFWEPGAYQIYINLALLFHFDEKAFSKEAFLSFETVILIISLITTFSTSGYFAFSIVVIWLIIKNWNTLKIRNRLIMTVPMMIVITIIIYVIFSSSAVVDKIHVRNMSYIRRRADFRNSIDAIIKSPLYGYGIGTDAYYRMIKAHNLYANSVGLFASSLNLGIVYATLFLVGLLIRGLRNFKNIIIPYVCIILVTAVTEDFFRYSIYFVLLLGFTNAIEKEKSVSLIDNAFHKGNKN